VSVTDDFTADELAALHAETRVYFSMADWEELEYLCDDSEDNPKGYTLMDRVILAYERIKGPDAPDEDVSCEGEEEGEEWAFYCLGLSLNDLLGVVRDTIPEGFKADIVTVPEDSLSGTAISITRR
jgi:hypothetical protein